MINLIKQDIRIYIYVAYSWPNGWTEWAEIFLLKITGSRGVSLAKESKKPRR